MFKIVKSSTYHKLLTSKESLTNQLNEAVSDRDHYKNALKVQHVNIVERGEKINSLEFHKNELFDKYTKIKSDFIECSSASENLTNENKNIRSLMASCEVQSKKLNDENVSLSKTAGELYGQNEILIKGISEAMAEMRKINRGKPSHNKSRAFQILERTIADHRQKPVTNNGMSWIANNNSK